MKIREVIQGEDAAGVGTITKQNTTADVKPGETERNLKKLHLINSVNEEINWVALRNAGAVQPMLYYPGGKDPETGRIIPPSVNQPNIITKVNLDQFKKKNPKGPGERLVPLNTAQWSDEKWQKYMEKWWSTEKNNLKAKEKIDQIRQSAKEEGVVFNENFADGRGPGRAGDSKRAGIPKGATITQLKRIRSSKTASARKKQLAHWQINMRQGRKK